MCIIFATLTCTWPENPADAISEVLNPKIFLGGMPPHANFPRIAQHHIYCPICARATTIFWLRHCSQEVVNVYVGIGYKIVSVV